MSSRGSQTLLLRPEVSRDDVDDAMAEAGCQLTNVVPPSQSHPAQIIFATADRRGYLYLVEDHRLGLVYLTCTGEGLETDFEQVGSRLLFYDDAEVAQMLAERDDEGTVIRALGIIALRAEGETPDDDGRAAVEAAFDHRSASVRNAALVASTYLSPWPSLRQRVAVLATEDEEDSLRLVARHLLEKLYQ